MGHVRPHLDFLTPSRGLAAPNHGCVYLSIYIHGFPPLRSALPSSSLLASLQVGRASVPGR